MKVAWQVTIRALAQAGNRAGRTEHCLQWWENSPEWHATTSAATKRRNLNHSIEEMIPQRAASSASSPRESALKYCQWAAMHIKALRPPHLHHLETDTWGGSFLAGHGLELQLMRAQFRRHTKEAGQSQGRDGAAKEF